MQLVLPLTTLVMILRETVSDHVPHPPRHTLFFIPNTHLFRHLKQKLPGFVDIFVAKKGKVHPWNKLKLYSKDPILIQIFSTINLNEQQKRELHFE